MPLPIFIVKMTIKAKTTSNTMCIIDKTFDGFFVKICFHFDTNFSNCLVLDIYLCILKTILFIKK
jgi:hypothetical protein